MSLKSFLPLNYQKIALFAIGLAFFINVEATESLIWTDSNPCFIEADSIPPTVNMSTNNLTVTGSFNVSVQFSEAIADLTTEDFLVENGTIENLEGDGTAYEATISPITGGTVTVKIPMNVVTDLEGNGNLASGQLMVTFVDSEKPTVELTTDEEWVDSIFEVKIQFSEPIVGLELNDFNVSNGAAIELMGSESTYSMSVNPGAVGAIAVFLPSDRVSDAAGNPNMISNFLTVNFSPLDIQAPTVELTTSNLNVNDAFTIDIEFNEMVEDMTLDDFESVNATISDLLGNGKEYSALVTPLADGEVKVKIPAASATDEAGNENEASNELIVNYAYIDDVAPTVFLSTDEMTVRTEFKVNIHFSEPVFGLVKEDFNLTNGIANHLSGEEADYELSISPIELGEVRISLSSGLSEDLAGNGNQNSNELIIQHIDGIQPTVTLSTPLFEVGDAFEVTITFSEAITDLTIEDFYVVNGSAIDLRQVGETYLLTVEPLEEGNIVVSLPANMVVDATGNGNIGSDAIAVYYTGEILADLLHLDMIQEENHLIIGWSTNTEYKNDYFILERSADGVNFEPIHASDSNFDSQPQWVVRYRYNDLSPITGTNFYRVKQVFEDGSFVYSSIGEIIYKTAAPEILVFPSPAKDFIYLNTAQFKGRRCEIILYNSLGQIFYHEIFEELPEQSIKLDVSDYQDGMYGVQFRVKELDKFGYKFMILKDD